jgi:hypothetical protein
MALGYWLINTAGIGGIIVAVAFLSLLIVYGRVLLWIREGGRVEGEGDGQH